MTLTEFFDSVQKDVLESRPSVSSERNFNDFHALFCEKLANHLASDLSFNLDIPKYFEQYLSDK